MDNLHQRQLEREYAARQAALGQRAKAIAEGRMGPVLRRWINADVVPIAALLRQVAEAYLSGDLRQVSVLLDAPTAELSERERPLKPLMEWVLRGRSPGRADTSETSHAEDLVLAFMAVVLMRLARDDKVTLSACLALAADALRDTVQGQFISGVQGAGAMQRIREHRPEAWKQRKSLNRICARLYGQAKPILDQEERGEREALKVRGGKKVMEIVDVSGELRRIEMRAPDVIDWEVMSLCWMDEKDSGTSPHRSLWLGFASLFLATAQRVGGWFVFAQNRTGRRGHTRTTKFLVLSEDAKAAIARDVERWTSLGFHAQPMIVPPEDNDYLTVKHRPVTGQRPPRGLLTAPETSSAWLEGAAALSGSPWTVNTSIISSLESESALSGLVDLNDPQTAIRIAEHKRLAADTFYLPTVMDFRGRIYYRTPWVSPQSGDLGKSLLCFPPITNSEAIAMDRLGGQALIMHLSGLAGLDKKPWPERLAWFKSWDGSVEGADKPLSLAAAWGLELSGQSDRIPVQLDGTCNGLQHLSALTRDEVGAAQVNLRPSTLDEPPADVYGAVAAHALSNFEAYTTWGSPEEPPHPWTMRLEAAGIQIDRKLTKGPVMVLPYGGTREAVRLAVKASVMAQLGSGEERLHASPWHLPIPGYEAFTERPLHEHPLFNKDVAQLSALVWDCITPAIPRAMKFMLALQEIGSWVGERALAWSVGPGEGCSGEEGKPLWVIQAKSKATRKQVTMRGFHLPDLVRRLTLMANSNEIDPKANRTGIVANFVHSLDAAHLATAVSAFKARGGSCVGSVHDCLLVRPSEAALMGRCLREEFVRLHVDNDPLLNPCKVGTLAIDGVVWKEYEDWYELAAEAGVVFPERGEWQVEEVLESAWFFS